MFSERWSQAGQVTAQTAHVSEAQRTAVSVNEGSESDES
jgi:hypothetical protein